MKIKTKKTIINSLNKILNNVIKLRNYHLI